MSMTRKELMEKMSEQIGCDEGEVADVFTKLITESMSSYTNTVIQDRLVCVMKSCQLCKNTRAYSKGIDEKPSINGYHICESCERMLGVQYEFHGIESSFEDYIESEVVLSELLAEEE